MSCPLTTGSDLFTVLSNDPTLTALLGPGKIFSGSAPQGTAYPYSVYSRIGSQTIVKHDSSRASLRGWLYQFDAYSQGGTFAAQAIIEAISLVLLPLRDPTAIACVYEAGRRDLWLENDLVYRSQMDIELWSNLAA